MLLNPLDAILQCIKVEAEIQIKENVAVFVFLFFCNFVKLFLKSVFNLCSCSNLTVFLLLSE